MSRSPIPRLTIATVAVLALGLLGSLSTEGSLARSTAHEALASRPSGIASLAPASTSGSSLDWGSGSTLRALPADVTTPGSAPTPEAPAAEAPPAPPPIQKMASASTGSTGRGPNVSDRVVLSYDDCPTSRESFTTMVLGAQAQGIALALFPTGRCLASGVFDIGFARAHGHYVFNHSISHPHFLKMTQAQVEAELGTPGTQSLWGRPPFGELSPTIRAAYEARGMRIWTWTVDTNDWRGPSTGAVVGYVVSRAKPGDTVLMHMQHAAFNPAALGHMQAGLAARGIQLCRNQGPTEASPATLDC